MFQECLWQAVVDTPFLGVQSGVKVFFHEKTTIHSLNIAKYIAKPLNNLRYYLT